MIAVIDSEQELIGAALYDQAACAETLERVRPEHFADPVHGLIWSELRKPELVDPILLTRRLGDNAGFQQMGGITFLAELVDRATVHTAHLHADAVIDAATRRQVHGLAQTILTDAEKPGSGEALTASAERALAEIAREGARGVLALPVGLTALDNLEAAWRGDFQGTPTGLQCLDHVTGGIRQDDVWFIGGRTSMGKSAVALSLGRGIAQQGRGVMMFSLEMPTREVQMRLIADLAYSRDAFGEQVRYGDLLKGRTGHGLRERSRTAARDLASLPFTVTDQGGLTIDEIRSQALRQVRAWEKAGVKAGAILVDHIGLVKPVRHSDSKAAETSYIVNELKALAKELRAPVIALAQVNRQTEGRNDKRPTLADLNWSGAIEQIADMICLLYRPAYYLERSSDDFQRAEAVTVKHELELLIHKNRAGPICNLKAWADVACNAVRDAA